MNWKAYHSRGEILRDVIEVADRRCDGRLPMDVEGVSDKFEDELDLLCTLQLKWHTRLAGIIERTLAEQPMGLEDAVITAWRSAVDEHPGVRAILDHYRAEPRDAAMANAMAKSVAKEHMFLAVMSGYSSIDDELAVPVGQRIEERAREGYVPAVRGPEPRPTLLDRLRSALAA